MAAIRLEHVRKVYPNGHVAAHDLDLEIADGQLLVLVGPSGCGKSTALRIVAGLETPSAGRILIDGEDVTERPPQARDVAMVFQSYALYPHMTVRENLAFPLRMRGIARGEHGARVEAVAGSLGLGGLLGRRPAELSGGQRQRVALGRALVRDPEAVLLDEPLSNLDARLRVRTRTELARMHRRLGATMIYVTHDQEEAMTLGTRVAVMREGRCLQVAPPMTLYRRPANAFVAGFVGSPAMNVLACTVRGGDRLRLECGGCTLALPALDGLAEGQAVLLGVRPEDIEITSQDAGALRGRVEVVEPLGSAVIVHAGVEGLEVEEPLRVVADPGCAVRVDELVGLRLRHERLHLFDAGSGARLDGVRDDDAS